jgi:hypothetical protein
MACGNFRTSASDAANLGLLQNVDSRGHLHSRSDAARFILETENALNRRLRLILATTRPLFFANRGAIHARDGRADAIFPAVFAAVVMKNGLFVKSGHG